ncbi:MAG TPA: hypothetical protein VFQ61_19465 [Polyangiaceae bacterium]|nr:hypothetical protein [Polyangiaceae bacterium]
MSVDAGRWWHFGAAVCAVLGLVRCVPVTPQRKLGQPNAIAPKPATPVNEQRATAPAAAPETYHWCDTAGLADISKEAESLEADIPRVSSDDEARALITRIHALGEQPCFRLAPKVRFSDAQSNAHSLRVFFARGGREWLHQAEAGRSREIIVPGPIPESPASSPSSPWVTFGLTCAEDDLACGGETRAWAQRAERVINAIGRRAPYSHLKDCRDQVRNYDAWLECRLARAGLEWAFPVGPSLKAPQDGLLFSAASARDCTEWRLTDVASGSAVWAQSCGTKPPAVSLGSIDSRLLREALFVSALTDRVVWGPAFQRLVVPEEIALSSDLGVFPDGFEVAAISSSLQVRHAWSYHRQDRTLFDGSLNWPEDLNRPERTYAVWLHDAADATWHSGCRKRRDYQTLVDQLAVRLPRGTSVISLLRRELEANQCARLPRPMRLGYRSGWQSSRLSLEEPFEPGE